MSAPLIFDRGLIRQRRQRALRQGAAPFLLERASEELLGRLSAVQREFTHVLDLGTPTPALAQSLGPRALRAAADLPADVICDEELLPFAPQSFDCVASALALQFVNDLPGALAQIRRALRPDGLFLACLIGGESLHELRAAFTQAESETSGGASPRVAPFADVRDMGGLLQRAGFALPVADVERVTVRYGHVFRLMADLRAMGATNALVARARAPLGRACAMRVAEIYAERFADPDGRVRATFDIVWLSGWAPHESQQKPLKPGSAQARLADALKTKG
ncbi:MAG: methyltransferase domain-containing protein [Hyphomicrobiales bacterium]|nr:methyltransferase domain-containing protein [Hyphomicrobiales bacterium]